MRLYAIIHGVPIDETGDSPNNPLTSREYIQISSMLTALLEMLQVWTLRNFLTQSNCRGSTAHVMGCLNPTGSLDRNIQQPTDRIFDWSCLGLFRTPSKFGEDRTLVLICLTLAIILESSPKFRRRDSALAMFTMAPDIFPNFARV